MLAVMLDTIFSDVYEELEDLPPFAVVVEEMPYEVPKPAAEGGEAAALCLTSTWQRALCQGVVVL